MGNTKGKDAYRKNNAPDHAGTAVYCSHSIPVVASGEITVFCTRWQWQMPILACASGQGKAGDGNAALLAKLPLDNRMRLAYL